MQVIDNRSKEFSSHGEIILDSDGNLYILILEKGERYPYHLVCLQSFTVLQSFDKVPTKDEIEEEIESTIDDIFNPNSLKIVID